MSEPDPHEQLAELLGLDIADITVTGATLYGQGGAATLTIQLSNGNTLEFDPARAMIRPQTLLAELAISARVNPALKQDHCGRALTLACSIAKAYREMTELEQARDWGCTYLQAACTIDVDTADQAHRWGAFAALRDRDPESTGNIVLRDRDESRLARTGWFLQFVRTFAPRVSHTRLPVLMEQTGWERSRRIKATHPTARDTLVWSFYTVPAGWEDDD